MAPQDGALSRATVLSAALHGCAALALLVFQAAPTPPLEPPAPLAVEIVLQAQAPVAEVAPPAPPAAAPAPSRVEPPPQFRAPSAAPKPVVHRPVPQPQPNPKAEPVPAPGAGPQEAKVEAARAVPSAPPAPGAKVESGPAVVDYGAYVGGLHERIARHRVYPPQALRRREEGDVRLRVTLAGDGRVVDILSLAEASASLTEAARHAIESAAPFDPPPRSPGAEPQLAFDVTVAFRLR